MSNTEIIEFEVNKIKQDKTKGLTVSYYREIILTLHQENKAKDEEIKSLEGLIQVSEDKYREVLVDKALKLNEITQLKEALESKGKEVEELIKGSKLFLRNVMMLDEDEIVSSVIRFEKLLNKG